MQRAQSKALLSPGFQSTGQSCSLRSSEGRNEGGWEGWPLPFPWREAKLRFWWVSSEHSVERVMKPWVTAKDRSDEAEGFGKTREVEAEIC